MSDVSELIPELPPDQRAIRAKCFHPAGTFVEFEREELNQSIPAHFEKIVVQYPHRLAVKMGDRALTYRELNSAANRVESSLNAVRPWKPLRPLGGFFSKRDGKAANISQCFAGERLYRESWPLH